VPGELRLRPLVIAAADSLVVELGQVVEEILADDYVPVHVPREPIAFPQHLLCQDHIPHRPYRGAIAREPISPLPITILQCWALLDNNPESHCFSLFPFRLALKGVPGYNGG
jgi:hypothetical protein